MSISFRYEKRAECFKKTYSSNHIRQGTYRGRIVQHGVDGDNTFDENLCDVEALDIVSRQEWGKTKKQQALPGVNFTKEQTFFINIAQVDYQYRKPYLYLFFRGTVATWGPSAMCFSLISVNTPPTKRGRTGVMAMKAGD